MLGVSCRGYKVTGLDKHAYPSLISAGNDLNKIVRTEYADPLYAHLASEAIEAWKSDNVFNSHFHQTGWLVCTSDKRSLTAQNLIYKPYEVLKQTDLKDKIKLIDTPEEILKYTPQLQQAYDNGTIKDWIGMWNSNNGWCMAHDAVRSACDEAQLLGVEFISGENGTVIDIYKDGQGAVVKCKDGSVHHADYAILCAGAWADTLIDLEGRCTARCWTVGHIQLTPDEAKLFRNMPIVDHSDLGFFFEPSIDGKIKFANAFPGYTNYQHLPSTDRYTSIPSDVKFKVTNEAFEALTKFKDAILPQFASKELIDTMVCWCLDSDDGNWIIDFYKNNEKLLVASGDSGMAFKFLPTIGKYISDALEKKLSPEKYDAWRWRQMKKERDNTRPGGDSKDLQDFPEWSLEVK
ncbi:FAD dependent oxidoreductase [Wallemia mellicola CBS 633.66]|uniref:FAD dependent oxidoreductase n=1 Tax=Wallemia mellicola (strain ATCC MYA-4683 / CBS 633.66) TaxID=671144 RepID=I4Y5G6_WALMC|nr:FAD dependent oxidoreductase [Wallemia mellicola CBS 633.66]EIM19208.1 FAD dependent oxidoreductase [Wallemia mellicola CBS 633.66]|eukprot:XP_006960705.1 FAD dependent oxidoreductase [Wallemia mellicola CBS 633.66]